MIEKAKEIEASYLKYLNKQLEMSLKSYETKSADVKLKELEETFRDPNILIESVLNQLDAEIVKHSLARVYIFHFL